MRATRRTNPRHQPLRGCAATSRAVRGTSASHEPRSARELEGSGVSRGHRGVGSHHQHQRVAEVIGVDARGCWMSPVWREASRPVLQKAYIQHPARTSEELRDSLGTPTDALGKRSVLQVREAVLDRGPDRGQRLVGQLLAPGQGPVAGRLVAGDHRRVRVRAPCGDGDGEGQSGGWSAG